MSNNSLRLFILALFYISISNAQFIEDQSEFNFNTITTAEGLSQNTVNTILKDKSGFLWFGTDDGLNRYDSYDIKIINIRDSNSKVSTGNKVFDLYEDNENILWIGTDDGLKSYNPVTEKVTKHNLFQNFSLPVKVNCIEKENKTQIWLGTSEGLVLYHKIKGVIEHYRYNSSMGNSLSNSEVLSLANYKNELWVGTNHGLNHFNKQNKQFVNYFHKTDNHNTLPGNTIRTLSVNKSGDLWIGTILGGVSYLPYSSEKFTNYNTKNSLLQHNEIYDIFQTNDNYIWVATNGGGLTKINQLNNTFTNYLYNSNHLKSIATNAIYSVYEDQDGILWAGTYGEGVSFNTSKKSAFKLITHQTHNPNSIIESRVRSIYLDSEEHLWFGTLGGISVYNPKNKTYNSYSHKYQDDNSLSFNTVTTILEDHEKRMWFGTYSGGLNLLERKNSFFTQYKHIYGSSSSISDDKIYALMEDNKKNLWVGTQKGLNLYDSKNNSFTTFGNLEVRDIKLAKNGNFIIATMGGISIFNPKTQMFSNFYSNTLISTPVSEVYINDKENKIWFCSQGKGIGYLVPSTKDFKFFTEKDGLSSNFVSSLIPQGNIFWVSTFKGLVKFNKNTEKFENFTTIHKLPSNQFQPKASVILPDNTFGFGGSKGLVVFNPDSINKITKPINIVFSSLKIDNKIIDINKTGSPITESLNSTAQLNLKANQNDFTIEFAALDFNNQGNNKYAYILEGYMNTWANLGASRSVGFTNLNHGNYIFKVKLINSNNENIVKSLKINIAPPFYATWWFKVLMAILLITALYYYKKYTIISTKQKNENELQRQKLKNEEDFNQMRFRFFTYVSHELRTPLTLISDPVSQLINNKVDKDDHDYHLLKLINKNVFRLLRLVDQILDISKIEGNTLNLQVSKQNIVKCIEDTTTVFHEFAIQNNISFKFNKEQEVMMGWVDEDKIEKIIYNLLSNAFKFTLKKGNITISVNYYDDAKEKVVISVKDSGIGIPEDKLSKIFEGFYQVKSAKSLNPNGAGIGLDYVNRLTKLHKGTINVESQIDKGSIFSLTIPIKKGAYKSKNIRKYTSKREPLDPITIDKAEQSEIKNQIKSHNKSIPKLLIVEDDFDIRSYLVQSLSQKFRVIDAPNGKEGLVKAKKHIPDLILSDTMMPVMDGIEFCKEIKKDETTSHIPFLFLSAWSSDEFKINGLNIGAIDYIKKPFSYNILESKIKNIIETNKKISEKSKVKLDFNPENTNLDSIDDVFVHKAYEVLDKNFNDPDFTAHTFKKEMNMSHSVLYRKLTQLTGTSANEFIRNYRLKRAVQIIEQNSGLLISEICIMTGFNDPKYFSKCFKQAYNMSPTDFAKKFKDNNEKLENT
ncbi:two-component regulator propeller domain-containing protein [Mariniflexile sp. AS56]|uniref:hybrid sensor histidine kinase/response regulator transcription factor n=1 Tax=Mariniflexile sp. AS56 TaxID=3063957 RepID=UPI0026F004D9|nr:two-component regulator propeller domain-containing protein [Mariniflexile sp. AS56]MDO7172512.1 two-component regulator propeller domain-containing protein [Mariniflexile sp. AS56]